MSAKAVAMIVTLLCLGGRRAGADSAAGDDRRGTDAAPRAAPTRPRARRSRSRSAAKHRSGVTGHGPTRRRHRG